MADPHDEQSVEEAQTGGLDLATVALAVYFVGLIATVAALLILPAIL
jgi:hypothetical protein